MPPKFSAGMTLLETMLVVALVGILAFIGFHYFGLAAKPRVVTLGGTEPDPSNLFRSHIPIAAKLKPLEPTLARYSKLNEVEMQGLRQSLAGLYNLDPNRIVSILGDEITYGSADQNLKKVLVGGNLVIALRNPNDPSTQPWLNIPFPTYSSKGLSLFVVKNDGTTFLFDQVQPEEYVQVGVWRLGETGKTHVIFQVRDFLWLPEVPKQQSGQTRFYLDRELWKNHFKMDHCTRDVGGGVLMSTGEYSTCELGSAFDKQGFAHTLGYRYFESWTGNLEMRQDFDGWGIVELR